MSEDNTDNGPKQDGNYFIMDSEQVISNPYHDLQAEALESAKKESLTERLTAVRNNVCEHNLRVTTKHLDKERTYSMRNIHMDTSNLRYQVKVMDIDKRKNELSLQKRINPKKDFSYDKRQIQNSAKRLGITSEESFYLDKKLQYPLRGNILKDHNAKPIIKKARKTMAEHTVRKKTEQADSERAHTARTYERATTAHTVSTTVDIPITPEPSIKEPPKHSPRMGSKSAPPPKISATEPTQRSTSRLSAIDESDGSKLPILSSSTSLSVTRPSKTHVKFNVSKPAPFKQSTAPFKQSTPSERLFRSKSFLSGVPRVTRSYTDSWDSDDEDDYLYCEKVDLRALFFGDKSQSGDTKSTVSSITTPRTSQPRMSVDIPIQFRSQSAKPKVTEEMVIKEQKQIREKIDNFLGLMRKEEEAEKLAEKKRKEQEEKQKAEEEEKAKDENVKSKAAILLSVFSKPIDHSKTWGFMPPKVQKKVETKEKSEAEIEAEKAAQRAKEEEEEQKNRTRDLWKLIKVNIQNGSVKRKYTANDLLLQQLTGILVHADEKTKIPIHAASRALRHTPTFKMRRVVEELMRQRTRYEQQEIEKLQQQEAAMDGGIPFGEDTGVQHYQPARAWTTPTRELEQET